MGFSKALLIDDIDMTLPSHDDVKTQIGKVSKTRKVKKSKSSLDNMPLETRLSFISSEVYKTLGRYKGFVKVINNKEDLNRYVDKVIEYGILSFDTETNNSLDPLTCKIMGLCCYVPNTKPVYVPINHTKPGTDIKIENQVSEKDAKEALERIKNSNTKLIYHNGKFDIRVCRDTLGVTLPIWWDTMVASQLLDENQLAKLKYQYRTKVDPTIASYNIEVLFTGLPYAWVDPKVFALYAAIDAYDTYKLQQIQQKMFEEEGMERLYSLFTNVEMPIVPITSKMEDDGICMDLEAVERLDKKFKKYADNAKKQLDEIMTPYMKEVYHYQEMGKLDDPLNYDSTEQVALILYDILKVPVGEEGRSSSKDALKAMKIPFSETLLTYRHYTKLISSFTQPLPTLLSPRDGKLHANFNQMGKEENNVRTGRFSSTDPNVQQIPSKEKTMRLMFKASTEYNDISSEDNVYCVPIYSDVLTNTGWVSSNDANIGDWLVCDDNFCEIKSKAIENDKVYLYC